MASQTLLDRVMAELVDAELVRPPGVAGAGARPWPAPFWRNPKDGAPAPGEKQGNELDDGIVVSGFLSGGIAAGAGEGYSKRRTVDVHYRAKGFPAIEELHDQVLQRFAPAAGGLEGAGIPGLRVDWTMGGLYVLESRQWTDLQSLGSDEGQGYWYRAGFLFETLT